MSKWTKEQEDAIYKDGTNIIVSAGAGSGKTSVLSARVVEKLKKGIKINELLILTFTNLAAGEMKERIRKKILENETLKDNLDYLESAYITTFDSFTLSLVKKYHYLLNVSPNISIISDSVINIIKNDYIEEVFTELYANKHPLFLQMVNDLTLKNDTSLKESLLDIIKKIDLISDKETFLDHYLENYLSSEKISSYISEYQQLLHKKLQVIETNLIIISNSSYPEYAEKLSQALDKLLKAKTYDEIVKAVDVDIPRRPSKSEEIKDYKDAIDKVIKELKSSLRFKDSEEIKASFTIMRGYIEVILIIIKKYYAKLDNYKKEYDLYEFNDIEIMAIKLLKENPLVREELKNYYQEILVDEYQDTNDLQEEFINLISNNNVYMVGDIKQSIYGFRNANPQIFKAKYDKYANNDGGIKIDLLANFRSREEVIKGVNEIFSTIMDDAFGNASYRRDHQMHFGNLTYANHNYENYDLEILNYQNDSQEYKNREIEAFIIAQDIKHKVENKFTILDKETFIKRPITYNDFCIIMDRGKSFSLYKKIFTYLGIPLTIYEDKTLTNETDVMLINNIITLILKIKNKIYDKEFTYAYMSIARSFLIQESDAKIFHIIKNKDYQNTLIYENCLSISKVLDTINNRELINLILTNFHFYEKAIELTNIEDVMVRIDNLLKIADDLSKMGYTIEKFNEYLSKMITSKSEIKYSTQIGDDGVKIMNIHKSKGLEFSVCYFASLEDKFNTDDLKKRYIFAPTYGIITPYFQDGIGTTILKDLYKDKYLLNDISEKIRLFYVALTRAKEKIIIVTPLQEQDDIHQRIVPDEVRMNYNSLNSMLNSLYYNLSKYIKNISLSSLPLTKDYLYNKKNVSRISKKGDVITFKELTINKGIKEVLHASSFVNTLLNEEESSNIALGLQMHKALEQTDFKHIDINNPYYMLINKLIKKLNISKNALIYKEHEFIFKDNDKTYHGIIDLLIISEDTIKIVDYKLKNIDNPKYIEQLEVYYKYVRSIYNKEIKMYLYSLLKEEIKEISLKTV